MHEDGVGIVRTFEAEFRGAVDARPVLHLGSLPGSRGAARWVPGAACDHERWRSLCFASTSGQQPGGHSHRRPTAPKCSDR